MWGPCGSRFAETRGTTGPVRGPPLTTPAGDRPPMARSLEFREEVPGPAVPHTCALLRGFALTWPPAPFSPRARVGLDTTPTRPARPSGRASGSPASSGAFPGQSNCEQLETHGSSQDSRRTSKKLGGTNAPRTGDERCLCPNREPLAASLLPPPSLTSEGGKAGVCAGVSAAGPHEVTKGSPSPSGRPQPRLP